MNRFNLLVTKLSEPRIVRLVMLLTTLALALAAGAPDSGSGGGGG